MPQERNFDAIQNAINEALLQQNISQQADLIANGSQRQKLKLVLIGSPELVQSAIHNFHLIGYAEVGDWSRFLPSPTDNPEEVMSILIRKATVQ